MHRCNLNRWNSQNLWKRCICELSYIWIIFIISLSFSNYVCMCIWVCAHEHRYPHSPEESTFQLDQNWNIFVSYWMLVLGIELKSSIGTKAVINYWASFQGLYTNILFHIFSQFRWIFINTHTQKNMVNELF